jgi:hypothetical protein
MDYLLNTSLGCYHDISSLGPSYGKLLAVPFVGSPVHSPDIVNKIVGTSSSEMNSYILAKFPEAK